MSEIFWHAQVLGLVVSGERSRQYGAPSWIRPSSEWGQCPEFCERGHPDRVPGQKGGKKGGQRAGEGRKAEAEDGGEGGAVQEAECARRSLQEAEPALRGRKPNFGADIWSNSCFNKRIYYRERKTLLAWTTAATRMKTTRQMI